MDREDVSDVRGNFVVGCFCREPFRYLAVRADHDPAVFITPKRLDLSGGVDRRLV